MVIQLIPVKSKRISSNCSVRYILSIIERKLHIGSTPCASDFFTTIFFSVWFSREASRDVFRFHNSRVFRVFSFPRKLFLIRRNLCKLQIVFPSFSDTTTSMFFVGMIQQSQKKCEKLVSILIPDVSVRLRSFTRFQFCESFSSKTLNDLGLVSTQSGINRRDAERESSLKISFSSDF